MKIAIALAFLICAVAAEYCDHTSDCNLTKCGTNFRLRCYSDNVCTCVGGSSSTSSSSNYDCPTGEATVCQTNNGNCDYNDHKWHCIDKKCHCRFFGRK